MSGQAGSKEEFMTTHTAARFSHDQLLELSRVILQHAGASNDEAATVAEALIDAEFRGIDSQGLVRLPGYAKGAASGEIRSNVEMDLLMESASALRLDARYGWGYVMGKRAIDMCIDRAEESGACFAVMLNTSHLGRLGYFVEHAARRGLIGVAASAGAQRFATQAPWGGTSPVFCTNPLAVGVPRRDSDPIVYDIATTQIARGAILMAQKRGEAIPEGWALDADGAPTTDPNRALPPYGTLAPLGGYKGSGLALVVEILSSVLGGYPPENSSSFFGAFSIDRFVERDTFLDGLEKLVGAMRASAPEDGTREVLLPGERSARRRKKNDRDGIEVTPALWNEITTVAKQLGVEHDLLEGRQ